MCQSCLHFWPKKILKTLLIKSSLIYVRTSLCHIMCTWLELNKITWTNVNKTAGERTTEGEDDFSSECELACTVDPKYLSIENNGLQDQNSQGSLAKPRKDVWIVLRVSCYWQGGEVWHQEGRQVDCPGSAGNRRVASGPWRNLESRRAGGTETIIHKTRNHERINLKLESLEIWWYNVNIINLKILIVVL